MPQSQLDKKRWVFNDKYEKMIKSQIHHLKRKKKLQSNLSLIKLIQVQHLIPQMITPLHSLHHQLKIKLPVHPFPSFSITSDTLINVAYYKIVTVNARYQIFQHHATEGLSLVDHDENGVLSGDDGIVLSEAFGSANITRIENTQLGDIPLGVITGLV